MIEKAPKNYRNAELQFLFSIILRQQRTPTHSLLDKKLGECFWKGEIFLLKGHLLPLFSCAGKLLKYTRALPYSQEAWRGEAKQRNSIEMYQWVTWLTACYFIHVADLIWTCGDYFNPRTTVKKGMEYFKTMVSWPNFSLAKLHSAYFNCPQQFQLDMVWCSVLNSG